MVLSLLYGVGDCRRVGEARHPGPDSEEAFEFLIGTANVAGLLHRADLVVQQPAGLWAYTETQLSLAGQRQFRSALRYESQRVHRDAFFVPGAPVPTRSATSDAGTWSGVAVVSSAPTKEIRIAWPGAEYVSGRVVITSTWLQSLPIVGGTVYGLAQSPTHRHPIRSTSAILDQVAEHIVERLVGPRFLCGDWNADLSDFAVTDYLLAHGWKELQVHAWETQCQPIRPTCKSVTVRDFLWLSPELWQMLKSVHFEDRYYPDHACLGGLFTIPRAPSPTKVWRFPVPLPWSHVRVSDWQETVQAHHQPFTWKADTTASFRSWSAGVENSLRQPVLHGLARIPARCKGRAQQLCPEMRPMRHSVVKRARPGEEEVLTDLMPVVVRQWYRQLRRLQALLHTLRNGYCTPGSWTTQAQTWRAIRGAPGFKPNFVAWWPTRAIHLPHGLSDIPQDVPTLLQMELLWHEYRLNYRNFEDWHHRQRLKLLQLRNASLQTSHFRQLRPPAADPLATLTTMQTSVIVDVCVSTGYVALPVFPWDKFATFRSSGFALKPLDHFEEQHNGKMVLWILFDTDLLLVPGMLIDVSVTTASLPDIHASLTDLWKSRWQRLADVPDPTWSRVIGFAHSHLPRMPAKLHPLSVDLLQTTLATGKGLRTRGPDGWDRQDLRALSPCHWADIVQLLTMIEGGAEWPQQLTFGIVTSLAKKTEPIGPVNYRPITLFSLWYRLWGSARARSILQDFSLLAPDGAFGYLCHRGCQDLTYILQATLESQQLTEDHHVGVLLDIKQCFNCIPRMPVRFLARLFGVATPTVTAWSSFLASMRRSFRVREALSDPIGSDTGLPEGDSMSCVGMVLLNFVYHAYMKCFAPTIRELSYVDNLQLISPTVGSLLQGRIVAETWADMLQLHIDSVKSTYWGTSASMRALLRANGCAAVESTKDLGVQMQYGPRHRNDQLQLRIGSSLVHWKHLAGMRLPRALKALAIRTALLPRTLHGGEQTFVGLHWFKQLRTQALRSLGVARAGANPGVRLPLVEDPLTDPMYYDIRRSVLSFWRYLGSSAEFRLAWTTHVTHFHGKYTHGPFGKFLRICETLQWSVTTDFELRVASGQRYDLLWLPRPHLHTLLLEDWRQHVAAGVFHRHDFAGISGLDYWASFQVLPQLTVSQTELLATIRDGTFFLHSFKARFDPGFSEVCPFCSSALDSMEHRACECEYFQPVRDRHYDCWTSWHDVPIALSHHGWCPANEWVPRFHTDLENLENLNMQWHCEPSDSGVQHLFTDGSCQLPGHPIGQLSSWAFELANVTKVVACGLLPGRWQGIARAELFAALQSLLWAAHYLVPVHLYCDSAFVVRRLRLLLAGQQPCLDWAHVDLWERVAQCLSQVPWIGVTKVASHRCIEHAATPFDAWCIHHNSVADVAAGMARLTCAPAALRRCYDAMMKVHESHCMLSRMFQLFLLDLAEHGLATSESAQLESCTEHFLYGDSFVNCHDFAEDQPIDVRPRLRANLFLCRFGLHIAEALHAWLVTLSLQADFLTPVSFVELFLGFSVCTKCVLPVRVDGASQRWLDVATLEAGDLFGRTLAIQVSTFRCLFDAVLGAIGCSFEKRQISRPTSGIVMALPGCIVPWPAEVADKAHLSLLAFCKRSPIRFSRDLARSWP